MIGKLFSPIFLSMNLDQRDAIEQLDSKNMLGSLELLGAQIEQVLEQAKSIVVPASYKKCANVVVLGMGGSTLGTYIIKSVFDSELKVPLEIVNGYHVPAYVSKNTLVIVSSYSGTTEEPVAAMDEAKKRGAKLIIISSGGELAKHAAKQKLPALIFSTENNPCGSPRMGLGYSIVGQMFLFAKAGLIALPTSLVKAMMGAVAKANKQCGVDSPTASNPAKKFASQLLERSLWYMGSSHLAGNVHAGANQLNENAKHFGASFLIPELNHHLLEGMAWPKTNPENLAFLLIESDLYDKRIQKRFAVTKDILGKNKTFFLSYKCQEKKKVLQAMECLVLTSYLSFYLAMVEGIDPTAIPFVDFFKEALKK